MEKKNVPGARDAYASRTPLSSSPCPCRRRGLIVLLKYKIVSKVLKYEWKNVHGARDAYASRTPLSSSPCRRRNFIVC